MTFGIANFIVLVAIGVIFVCAEIADKTVETTIDFYDFCVFTVISGIAIAFFDERIGIAGIAFFDAGAGFIGSGGASVVRAAIFTGNGGGDTGFGIALRELFVVEADGLGTFFGDGFIGGGGASVVRATIFAGNGGGDAGFGIALRELFAVEADGLGTGIVGGFVVVATSGKRNTECDGGQCK